MYRYRMYRRGRKSNRKFTTHDKYNIRSEMIAIAHTHTPNECLKIRNVNEVSFIKFTKSRGEELQKHEWQKLEPPLLLHTYIRNLTMPNGDAFNSTMSTFEIMNIFLSVGFASTAPPPFSPPLLLFIICWCYSYCCKQQECASRNFPSETVM